jgi:hypothetical protein
MRVERCCRACRSDHRADRFEDLLDHMVACRRDRMARGVHLRQCSFLREGWGIDGYGNLGLGLV